MSSLIQYLHLVFQHGSGSSVKAIMSLLAKLALGIGLNFSGF